MQWLVEPFQYEFFRTGIAGGDAGRRAVRAAGVYIVLRGMSLHRPRPSHAIFGGAVVPLSCSELTHAGPWGFPTAVLINQTARRTRIGADAAIGVITTASFAVGVALISRQLGASRSPSMPRSSATFSA